MRALILLGCLLALSPAALAEKGAPFEPDCTKLLPTKEIEKTCGITLRKDFVQLTAANSPTPPGRCNVQYQETKTRSFVDVTIDWGLWKGVKAKDFLEGHRDLPGNHDYAAIDGLGTWAVRYLSDAPKPKFAVSFPTVEVIEDRWIVTLVSAEEPRKPPACSLDKLVELARSVDTRLKNH